MVWKTNGTDDGFDADIAITMGELQHLLPDLIAALGGPLAKEAAVSRATVAPVATGNAPWDGVAA